MGTARDIHRLTYTGWGTRVHASACRDEEREREGGGGNEDKGEGKRELEGGAKRWGKIALELDQSSLARNRTAFRRIRLGPRACHGLRSTRTYPTVNLIGL